MEKTKKLFKKFVKEERFDVKSYLSYMFKQADGDLHIEGGKLINQ